MKLAGRSVRPHEGLVVAADVVAMGCMVGQQPLVGQAMVYMVEQQLLVVRAMGQQLWVVLAMGQQLVRGQAMVCMVGQQPWVVMAMVCFMRQLAMV